MIIKEDLSRQEKIAILKRFMAGELDILDGHFVEKGGIVVIEKNGQYFWDAECKNPVSNPDELNNRDRIILPYNGRI